KFSSFLLLIILRVMNFIHINPNGFYFECLPPKAISYFVIRIVKNEQRFILLNGFLEFFFTAFIFIEVAMYLGRGLFEKPFVSDTVCRYYLDDDSLCW